MKTLRLVLRPILVAVGCATIAACTNSPTRQSDLDYQSRPSPRTQSADANPDASDRRLTIRTGSGAKLNLPWFVRDTQDLINSN